MIKYLLAVAVCALAMLASPSVARAQAAAPQVLGLKNITINCLAASAATAIPQGNHIGSLICWNLDPAIIVYLGDSTTTNDGVPICGTGTLCPLTSWPPDVGAGAVYYKCSSNVTFRCVAGSVSTSQ